MRCGLLVGRSHRRCPSKRFGRELDVSDDLSFGSDWLIAEVPVVVTSRLL